MYSCVSQIIGTYLRWIWDTSYINLHKIYLSEIYLRFLLPCRVLQKTSIVIILTIDSINQLYLDLMNGPVALIESRVFFK